MSLAARCGENLQPRPLRESPPENHVPTRSTARIDGYDNILQPVLTAANPSAPEAAVDNTRANHQLVYSKLVELGDRILRIESNLRSTHQDAFSGPIEALRRIWVRVCDRNRVNVPKLKLWLAHNFPFNDPGFVDQSAVAKIVEIVEFVNPVDVCSRVRAYVTDLDKVLDKPSPVSVVVAPCNTLECSGSVNSSYFSALPNGPSLQPGTVVAVVGNHFTADGVGLETLAVANSEPDRGGGYQFSQGWTAVVERGASNTKPLFELTMFTDGFEADVSAIYAPIAPQRLRLTNVLIPGKHVILMAKVKTACYVRSMWLVWPWDSFCRGEHTFYWIWPIMTATTDAHAISLSYEFTRP